MAAKYTTTIGLEVHAQLKTVTKLFSNSANNPNADSPNSIVSPIDAAHPGTLPALNHAAVKKVIEVGLAVGANIAEYTEWDRKNYFYPDIPKAYQISQYKYPLVTGGKIAGFDLTRIHLEEDTGSSSHQSVGLAGDAGDYSLVDLNRAGMPLMELVTEPVMHSPQDAVMFAKELQLLLRFLGVSDANLEKGEMRIEVNISISDTDELGTKVEVKNINSFKAVERAIEYEINRHREVLEAGETIDQETRGWDENTMTTFSQRAKEDAHDYRYFPDPDIPKLFVREVFDLDELRDNLPELPVVRREALVAMGINLQQVDLFMNNVDLYNLYSVIVSELADEDVDEKKIANIISTNYLGLTSQSIEGELDNITVENLVDAIKLSVANQISSSALDALLQELYQRPGNVSSIVESKGLKQNNDSSALEAIARQVIDENPEVVAEYRAGKETVIKFLMGQGMKLSKGSANPQMLEKVIQGQILQ